MSYSVQSDIENAHTSALVIELTDDTATGSADVAKVARAISAADAMIDAHLRAHYDVPLATTPDMIRDLSVEMAIFNLYKRRASGFELPEWVTTMHEDHVHTLKLIRRGELDLGVEPPPPISTAVVATIDGPDRLFTEDTLKNF